MTPNAQHKRAERERRKAAGDRRLEIWVGKREYEDLQWIMDEKGYSPEIAVSMALYVYRTTT